MKGIRRLADHLDISIGTVSRALNGHPEVSADTRKRVLEAAASMGYVANQAGRALRKGASSIVGFMIETGEKTATDGDTFFLSVFDGVQTVLARHKLELVALLCSSAEDPDEYLRRIVARGFADGIIISATQRRDPRIDLLADHRIPFVALGRSLTDRGHAWYDLDFEDIVRASIGRLASRGHTRIALAAPRNEVNLGYVLVDAYKRELAKHGIVFDAELILRSEPDQAGGYDLAQQILRMPKRPTAIILASEVPSVGLYTGLMEAGVHPGRDIAIIGRDSPHARFLTPSLTRFTTSLRDLGIALAEALLSTMPAYSEIYPQEPARNLWPLELLEGDSDNFTLTVRD